MESKTTKDKILLEPMNNETIIIIIIIIIIYTITELSNSVLIGRKRIVNFQNQLL